MRNFCVDYNSSMTKTITMLEDLMTIEEDDNDMDIILSQYINDYFLNH